MSLPSGWASARLSEACSLNPKLVPAARVDEDVEVTFVPMAAVDEISGVIAHPEKRRFGDVVKGYTSFREDDVLFAKVTPCMENGKSAIVRTALNGLGFGSTEFHVLRPNDLATSDFLHQFVRQKAFRDRAASAFVGTGGLQRVPPDFFSRVRIPLPTIPEQKRIVEIVQHAEGIRTLKSHALNLSRALIRALYEEHFGIAGATKRWPMEPFGRHTTYSKYGPRFPDQPYSESGVHILRTTDMNDDGTIRWQEAPTLALTQKQIDEHALKPGTLIVSRSGTIGPFAVFDGADVPCVAGAYLIEFGLSDSLDHEYARALFATPYVQAMLRKAVRSVAQPNINAPNIQAIPIPVPALEKQQEFSARVRALKDCTDRISDSALKLEELIAAIAGEAFLGKLTNQWRDDNSAVIAEAARSRDALLAERGSRDAPISASVSAGRAPVLHEPRSRTWLIDELGSFQREVLSAFNAYCVVTRQPLLAEDADVFARFCDDPTVADRIQEFGTGLNNRVRRTLSQLAALGLIAKVTIPKQNSDPTGREFLKAFRPLRDDEFVRLSDLTNLRRSLLGAQKTRQFISVQLDYETSEHAGAGGMFQVISVEDDAGLDMTYLVDQGHHYASLDDLKQDLAKGLKIESSQIELEVI